MNELVLSLFPGIGLLDMAFEREGFCVVRGPDLLWGGDIKQFHPPPGKFAGIIGGPPCPSFSQFRYIVQAQGRETAPNLIPEFERCISEAKPDWFLMENVRDAPKADVEGYAIHTFLLNNRWIGETIGGEQNRLRRFSFGVLGEKQIDLRAWLDVSLFNNPVWLATVTASGTVKPGIENQRAHTRGKYMGWKTRKALQLSLRAQGLPDDFLLKEPFTIQGKHKVVGNGVPLPMGRAVAQAVRRAMYPEYDSWRAAHAGEIAGIVAWAEGKAE